MRELWVINGLTLGLLFARLAADRRTVEYRDSLGTVWGAFQPQFLRRPINGPAVPPGGLRPGTNGPVQVFLYNAPDRPCAALFYLLDDGGQPLVPIDLTIVEPDPVGPKVINIYSR